MIAVLLLLLAQSAEPASAEQQPVAPQPAAPAAPARPQPPQRAETAQLYSELFPPPDTEPVADDEEQPIFHAEGGVAVEPGDTSGDWGIGPLRFRPSVVFSYVSADSSFFAGTVEDQEDYLQVQPSLGFRVALPGLRFGRLALSYEPRFRTFTDVTQLRKATHEFTATLDAPAGAVVEYGLSDRYITGILETIAVDPGREYFPSLSRFSRNEAGAYVRVRPGALFLELAGSAERVRFAADEAPGSTAFTDYDRYRARAFPAYEVSEGTRLGLRYDFERIPAADGRPANESTAHSVMAGGVRTRESNSLLTGHAWVGYRTQDSPNAGPGGTVYEDVVWDALAEKEFSRAWMLRLRAARLPRLSAFETNAFYVNDHYGAELTVPLLADVIFAAAGAFDRNEYRVPTALGTTREDEITSWSVGLGRPVTRFGFLRVDYRDERRRSNLDVFDVEAQAVIVQLGLGVFGPSVGMSR